MTLARGSARSACWTWAAMAASITVEAVRQLGLAEGTEGTEGTEVTAVIKASDVIVAVG